MDAASQSEDARVSALKFLTEFSSKNCNSCWNPNVRESFETEVSLRDAGRRAIADTAKVVGCITKMGQQNFKNKTRLRHYLFSIPMDVLVPLPFQMRKHDTFL
jgi:hypothetical protein